MSIQSVLATCRADVAAGVVVQDKVLDMHQGLALTEGRRFIQFSLEWQLEACLINV